MRVRGRIRPHAAFPINNSQLRLPLLVASNLVDRGEPRRCKQVPEFRFGEKPGEGKVIFKKLGFDTDLDELQREGKHS